MTSDAWLTLAVTLVVFVAMLRDMAPPDLLFLGATTFLAICQVITPTEAYQGFSDPGVLTVAVLFAVAAALRETGVLEYVGFHLLGRAKTENGVLVRLSALVLPLSAFLNNTPIVAMFLPIVLEWSRRHRVAASKLLIPLSYLTILGGTCTLIGTSTNLVVHGLMLRNDIPGMGLFEIGKIGLPYAVIGLVYLFFGGRKLLPDRKELLEQLGETRREYLVEMLVGPGCRLIGKTVEEAGLRHLPGLFLIEIDRDGTVLGPVGPDDLLQENDRLVFTGIVSSIVELEMIPGLVPAADPTYEVTPSKQRRRQLCEAVISNMSPLIGKTIREADFRASYGAAVVAVHRNGARVTNKVGDIVLRAGDTLLLQTRPHFPRAYRNDPAFYLVTDVQDWRPLRRDRAWIAVALFAVLIVVMTSEIVEPLVAATGAAVLMVAFGCISAGDARQSIEWQVLVTIAASFGVGQALNNSGAAAVIAGYLVNLTSAWGPTAAVATIFLITSVMTSLVTNNAAAVLMFHFALETARLYGVNPRPFIMALVVAASAAFMTPIGYQTNMMVYGPGGYRFSDYLRIGTPLTVILWVVAVVLIPILWPFELAATTL